MSPDLAAARASREAETLPPELAARITSLENELRVLAPQYLPAVLGGLERLRAFAWAKLTTASVTPNGKPEAPEEDRLLTAQEAAKIAAVPPRWFSRHPKLPFLRKVGKYLRIEESGFHRWLASRKTLTT